MENGGGETAGGGGAWGWVVRPSFQSLSYDSMIDEFVVWSTMVCKVYNMEMLQYPWHVVVPFGALHPTFKFFVTRTVPPLFFCLYTVVHSHSKSSGTPTGTVT